MNTRKKKRNKLIMAALLIVILIAGIIITRNVVLSNRFYACCSEGNLDKAKKIAVKLNNDKIWERYNTLYAKDLERHDICQAIEMYYQAGTDEAKARAEELTKYLKYGGDFVNDEGDARTIKIAIRDGELYYGYGDHYARLGEDIKYTTAGHYKSTIKIDQDLQELYINTIYDKTPTYVNETLRFVSVNSPQYLDKSYLDKGHDYYSSEINRSYGDSSKPNYNKCCSPGCNRKPISGYRYCREHKCVIYGCTMKKSADSSYCSQHSNQYANNVKGTYKHSGSTYDPYDVQDYDNADTFADDKYEEFYDNEDDYDDEDEAYDAAVDYWDDNH